MGQRKRTTLNSRKHYHQRPKPQSKRKRDGEPAAAGKRKLVQELQAAEHSYCATEQIPKRITSTPRTIQSNSASTSANIRTLNETGTTSTLTEESWEVSYCYDETPVLSLENTSFAHEDPHQSIHSPPIEQHISRTNFGCPSNFVDSLQAIGGKHIVDLAHVIQQTANLKNNMCCHNSAAEPLFVSEKRIGLISQLQFHCSHCKSPKYITTNKDRGSFEINHLSLNDLAVWGFMAIGGGHANMDESFSVMGIHPMSQKTFNLHEQKVQKIYEQQLCDEILLAGEEEKKLAVENGDVTPDGIIFIRVIVDATFSKRSYGHAYNAKSACGVIIGARTKKLLFLSVRNKYCCICAIDEKKGVEIRSHTCFKNWEAATTAMEADIIVEGFLKSESMHGLQYRYIVGDGDSSVYERIQSCVPYGRRVKKVECANHVVKNYTKRLYKLQAKSAENKRRLPRYKIHRLKRRVRGAIVHASEELAQRVHGGANFKTECWELTKSLKSDLLNVASHAFNNHNKCRKYFCDKLKTEDEYSKLDKTLQYDLQDAVRPVVDMASCILENETSNLAEYCMSLIAKAVGGKQINRSQRGKYTARATIAGMQFQQGREHHYQVMKRFVNASPASPIKKHSTRIKRKRALARKRLDLNVCKAEPKKKYSLSKLSKPTHHEGMGYGPRSAKPDASDQEMVYRKTEKLKSLQVTTEERNRIERATVEQSECDEWHIQRQHRLTASHFGSVVKKKDSTPCEKFVKKILYPRDMSHLDPIQHGKECEPLAIAKYEQETGKSVTKCGLFVDLQFGLLGASPDGLLEDNGIIEVKCPYTARDLTIPEAIQKIKDFCLKQDKNSSTRLRDNHGYYYQVQGQLHVCQRDYCDFVVYTHKDMYVQRIVRDDKLWKKIEPRLLKFYNDCLLPEIVDSRYARSMPIREPETVVDAQQEKLNKRENAVAKKGSDRKKDSL